MAEQPEVRHPFLDQPYSRQLCAVERVIQVVVAEQLRLLHSDCREHGDRLDAIRGDIRDVQDHSAAHAETQQVRTLDTERVHQLQDVAGVRSHRVVWNVVSRVSESRKVGCDDPVLIAKKRRKRAEVLFVTGTPVNKNYRWTCSIPARMILSI